MLAGAEVERVLAEACAGVGLDPTGAELLQHTMNAVFLLPREPVIVRLRRRAMRAAGQTVAVAYWLADRQVPVTPPLPGIDQPVELDDYAVTFWSAASRLPEPWQGADLAPPLRRLHALRPPAAGQPELPTWDPFRAMSARLRVAAELLDPEDRQWLVREAEGLQEAYERLRPTLRHGVIHADAHIGNLVRDRAGRVLLCDLDSVAYGPLLQDLVPVAVNAVRFGQRVRHRTLAYAYGVDVTREPAWPVLRRIRELTTTVNGVARGRNGPRIATRALCRLRTLQAGDDRARWVGYGQP